MCRLRLYSRCRNFQAIPWPHLANRLASYGVHRSRVRHLGYKRPLEILLKCQITIFAASELYTFSQLQHTTIRTSISASANSNE